MSLLPSESSSDLNYTNKNKTVHNKTVAAENTESFYRSFAVSAILACAAPWFTCRQTAAKDSDAKNKVVQRALQ